MTPTARRSRTIVLCLAVVYLVGGSNYLAQRIAVTGFPPLRMVGIRFAVAGVLLYAALRARGAEAPSARQWGAAALSAIPLLSIGIGGIAIAVQRAPSGLAALVFGSVPLWTVLFDRLRGGRLARADIGGLALGIAGVALVSSRGALRGDPIAAGVLVTAAAGHGLGCALTRRMPIPPGPLGQAAQMVSGGVLLLVASAATGEHMTTPGVRSVLALGYEIAFGSILVYCALGYLLRHARPALATSHAYVQPLLAVGLGATLGGERVTRADLFGLGLVLSAVALFALGARERQVVPRTVEASVSPSV
jgi:drug/metabolite transporter (DMT)-like permease